MLSSVLKSDRAVAVNLEIMRAFVRIRRALAGHGELARAIKALDRRFQARSRAHESHIRRIYELLDAITNPPGGEEEPPRSRIGFRASGAEEQ